MSAADVTTSTEPDKIQPSPLDHNQFAVTHSHATGSYPATLLQGPMVGSWRSLRYHPGQC